MRTAVIRVVALAFLLLLVLASVLTLQTMRRLPGALVYFVADAGNYLELKAVGRRGGSGAPEERARQAVEELARGPSAAEEAQGLSSSVPASTRVRAAQLVDGILHIDLSGEFDQGGGSAAMQARLYQLFYTLTQPHDVEGVQLMLDGRPVEVFGGEGIVVESPWLRSEHPQLPLW